MPNPSLGFLYGLLGASKALETGAGVYNERKSFQARMAAQQAKETREAGYERARLGMEEERVGIEKSRAASEAGYRSEETRGARAKADLTEAELAQFRKTGYLPGKAPGSRSQTETSRSGQRDRRFYDLEKMGAGKTPRQQAEFERLAAELGRSTGTDAEQTKPSFLQRLGGMFGRSKGGTTPSPARDDYYIKMANTLTKGGMSRDEARNYILKARSAERGERP